MCLEANGSVREASQCFHAHCDASPMRPCLLRFRFANNPLLDYSNKGFISKQNNNLILVSSSHRRKASASLPLQSVYRKSGRLSPRASISRADLPLTHSPLSPFLRLLFSRDSSAVIKMLPPKIQMNRYAMITAWPSKNRGALK